MLPQDAVALGVEAPEPDGPTPLVSRERSSLTWLSVVEWLVGCIGPGERAAAFVPPSMKVSIAAMRSLTEVKVARRIAWRVTDPEEDLHARARCGEAAGRVLGPHALRH
jgi:hypothetical protein